MWDQSAASDQLVAVFDKSGSEAAHRVGIHQLGEMVEHVRDGFRRDQADVAKNIWAAVNIEHTRSVFERESAKVQAVRF